MPDGFNFGDWFSRKKEYHRITVPNNVMMEDMGLYAFNSGTLYDILLEEKNVCVSGDESVFWDVPLPGGPRYDEAFALKTYNKILDSEADEANVKYWYGGSIEKRLTSYDNIIHTATGVNSGKNVLGALQQHHDFVTLPSGGNDAADKWTLRNNFVSDVQTSLGGSGISWEVPLCFRFGTSGVDGADCIKCSHVNFHAMLYDFDSILQQNRTVALKGAGTNGPLIAAAPSTVYGKPGMPNLGHGPGVFTDPTDGGTDNPSNVVAAPLDMHFNQNTGMFEAGTRMMCAAMLTSLDGVGAKFKNVDVEFIDQKTQDEICANRDSAVYLGAFELGRAMPIGVKGSNPNIYGPDLRAANPCDKLVDKERVVVVNRTKKSYKKGERVLLAYIDGEWQVLQSMQDTDDEGLEMFASKVDPTHYMMTNMANYFRHRGPHDSTNNLIESPQRWEEIFHERFYWDLGEVGHRHVPYWELNAETFRLEASDDGELVPINRGEDNIYAPCHGYWQWTSFDMLSDHMGGVNDWNLIAGTHAGRGADGKEFDDMVTKMSAVFPFAGINLPDGYSASKMVSIKNMSENNPLTVLPVGGQRTYDVTGGTGHHEFIVDSYLSERDNARPFDATKAGKFDAEGSFNAQNMPGDGSGPAVNAQRHYSMFEVKNSTLQVPADVALNAPPNGNNGFPLESLGLLKECINFGPSTGKRDPVWGHGGGGEGVGGAEYKNLAMGVGSYLSSGLVQDGVTNPWQARYGWMEYKTESMDSSKSLYDWAPIDNRHFSFIPLTAELYTHFDYPNPVYVEARNYRIQDPYMNFILPAGAINYPNPVDAPIQNHFKILGNKFFKRETNSQDEGEFYIEDTSFKMYAGRYYGTEENPIQELRQATYYILPYSSMNGADDWLECAGWKWSDPPVNPYSTRFLKGRWNQKIAHGQGYKYWDGPGEVPGTEKCTPGEANNMYKVDGSFALGVMTTKVRLGTSAKTIRFHGTQSLGVDYLSSSLDEDERLGQWGTSQDKITDLNTSQLYARVVDAWPDEQTIFDPRYFSVHHFHQGQMFTYPPAAWYSGGRPLKADAALIYGTVDGTKNGTRSNTPPPSIISEPAGGYDFTYSTDLFAGGIYLVDQQDSEVDFQVPTWMDADGSPRGGIVAAGTKVDINSKLRKKQDWIINPVKRGMLMPFNYYHRTIGVTSAKIVDGGHGYRVGDILVSQGGAGGGCYLKVTEIEGDSIKKLAFFKADICDQSELGSLCRGMTYGYNFDHTDFLGSISENGKCTGIDPRTGLPDSKQDCEAVGGTWVSDFDQAYELAPVKFVNYVEGGSVGIDNELPGHGVSLGTGAKIYAVQGIVLDQYNPEKGINRGRPVTRISLPSDNGERTIRHGRAEGGFDQNIIINDGDNHPPSPNHQYDVFLHFHNDISYTSLGDHTYAPAWLQYLNVKISPAEVPEELKPKVHWFRRLLGIVFPQVLPPTE